MNKLALEKFLSQVDNLSAEDLRTIRAEMVRRLAKNTVTLGDQDTDLLCIGHLEHMANQKEADQLEAGMSEEQVRATDIARLSKLGGVGAKFAEKYLKEKGSPWESAARKARRELAKPAPEVEPTSVEPTPEEHERGREAYERLDPHHKRLAPRKD